MMAEQTVPMAGPQDRAAHEPTRSGQDYVSPAVDIYEDEQGLHVIADLPGVEPNAVDVRVDRGVLTIQAQANHLVKMGSVYREYELTGFFRQFQLPEEIDAAKIAAEMKNGVLILHLPRAERMKPRRIEVVSS
jgi:HSP20 family molecular chaperone IbpA